MHEDKLGKGWHNRVRSILGIKKSFLTDEMMENDQLLSVATLELYKELGKDIFTDIPETPLNQEMYRKAFLYFVGSVIAKTVGLESKHTELRQKGVIHLYALTQKEQTPRSEENASKRSYKLKEVS